ncbi:hypothetical protein BH23ACT9_BH23ACT9_11740 [soil metagenome]
MSVRRDRPFARQPRANVAMAAVLQAVAVTALVLGILGAVVPGQAGVAAAWGAVACVVGAPLARVGWLGIRWTVRGDARYAVVAFGLLLVVVAGGAGALLLST